MVTLASVRHLWALRSFEAAARLRSFQKAAEELHLTPSAVSHQIKRLEEELGQALFVRMPRMVRLTPAGETLFLFASRGFLELSRGLNAISETVDLTELRVSAAPSFAAAYLTSRVAQFERDNPSLKLKLDVNQSIVDLEERKFDIAIRLISTLHNSLFSEVLTRIHPAPVCSPDIASQLKSIDDIQRLTRITITQASNDWNLWYKSAGYAEAPNPRREVFFTPMMDGLQAATDGVGIMIAPIEIIQKPLRDGRLVAPFRQTFAASAAYHLVCRSGEENFPKIAKFRKWIRRAMREETATLLTKRRA